METFSFARHAALLQNSRANALEQPKIEVEKSRLRKVFKSMNAGKFLALAVV